MCYVLINIDVPDEYKRLAEAIDQEKWVLVNYRWRRKKSREINSCIFNTKE